jgi:hypothetical protein
MKQSSPSGIRKLVCINSSVTLCAAVLLLNRKVNIKYVKMLKVKGKGFPVHIIEACGGMDV